MTLRSAPWVALLFATLFCLIAPIYAEDYMQPHAHIVKRAITTKAHDLECTLATLD